MAIAVDYVNLFYCTTCRYDDFHDHRTFDVLGLCRLWICRNA